MGLDKETAKGVLKDYRSLQSAFVWDDTEQGHDFWSEQDAGGLSEEGRTILERIAYGNPSRAAAPLFAVGDKVRVVKGTCLLKEGKTYTVVEYPHDGSKFDVYVVVGNYGVLGYGAERFEPVAVAASNDNATTKEGKFKVGDRVRYIGKDSAFHSIEHMGKLGTITGFDRPDFADVQFDDGTKQRGCYPDNIEPAPLTIQAGRFYRTRDGRKVGPMVDSKRGWLLDDREYSYFPNGKRLGDVYGDEIIAEWPAEHDPASTAGFTIPLCAMDADLGTYTPGVANPDATLTTKITVDFTDFDAELDRIFARLRKLRRKSKKLGIRVDSSGLQDAA